MVLKILPITPALLTSHPSLVSRLTHVHLTSFLTNAVYAAIYPAGLSQTIITASIDRHRTAILHDPTARYLAVIDCPDSSSAPESGLRDNCENLIAFGKYQLFPTVSAEASRKDTSERIWPPGTNMPLVDDFWGQIKVVRGKWGPRLGAHVQLDLLATMPDFQGKGAGGIVVSKVGEECDQRGLPGFLEGSPEGLRAYQKGGFVDVEERVRVDLGRYEGSRDRGEGWREFEGVKEGGEWKGRGWYENVVMVRPARGRGIEEYLD